MKNLEDIKELLIVVDMINGFVDEGALADTHIRHIIKEILNLIKEFKSASDKQVAFIKDAHKKDSMEFKSFKNIVF